MLNGNSSIESVLREMMGQGPARDGLTKGCSVKLDSVDGLLRLAAQQVISNSGEAGLSAFKEMLLNAQAFADAIDKVHRDHPPREKQAATESSESTADPSGAAS